MKEALSPIWRLWALTWYRWAQREIHPLHADVPRIVHAIARLEAKQRGGA